jgi:DNA-binding NtrC family response regulator
LRFVALRALDALAATIAARSPASGPIVGAAMARLDPVVGRVASGSINVLILGETGVGKEIMARAIHERSPRASAPMVCLNCAALSESLLESELFGHEKGAFTGATQSKPGLLEAAQGGTVFLDEIGEMPMGLQAKMLRVLEQREVLRIGALKPRAIDVRFVSATHRDPAREIEAGRLRQDLYFRLNGVTIEIPPLRSRVDEIEPLARAFLESACRQLGRAPAPRIAREVAAALIAHPWPGNIRELRNTMERAVLLCEGDVIGFDHVQLQAVAAAARLHPSIGEVTSPITGASPMRDDAERARILDALDKTHWNQTRAAELLGMSRRTLVTRLGDYQLPRPRKRGDGP